MKKHQTPDKPGRVLSLKFKALSLAVGLLVTAHADAEFHIFSWKPKADLAEVHYGAYPDNVLDLWKAKSATPTPLVVYIHGGGFYKGDKSKLSTDLLRRCLDSGISVMAVNYRLSPQVHFPTHYMDCARAIQFARLHASDWNIDPKRIAATGDSAGGGTSLWIGFHNDLADPSSSDPVLRESTHLTCMAVEAAQTSYDPRVVKEWIGESTARHPGVYAFYGLTKDELDSPRAYRLYEEASPINYLTATAPPVMLTYYQANVPLPPGVSPRKGVHHPVFGEKLKERMTAMNLECIIKQADDYEKTGGSVHEDMVAFFAKHFAIETPAQVTAR